MDPQQSQSPQPQMEQQSQQPQQPQQPQPSLKTPYIAVLIGVLVVFAFIVVFLYMGYNSEKKQSAQTQRKITTSVTNNLTTSGFMKLETTVASVTKNQPITITLVADSNKTTISGYDVLVAYDTEAFDFVKGTSKIKDFSIYTFKRSGHVTVTAVKALQSNIPTVFTNTPVMELTFQPKKTGSYIFSIKKMIGAENTSFVSTKSKKLLPLVNTVPITVE